MATDNQSPLRKIGWLAEFLDCSEYAAYHAVNSGNVPSWCVVRLGRHIRVNEVQVRHWANGGKEAVV